MRFSTSLIIYCISTVLSMIFYILLIIDKLHIFSLLFYIIINRLFEYIKGKMQKIYYWIHKIDSEILQKYECGISHEIMSDPVTTECGQIYDRKNIEKWLLDHDTDPLTNTLLTHKNVCAALHIRREIKEFIQYT